MKTRVVFASPAQKKTADGAARTNGVSKAMKKRELCSVHLLIAREWGDFHH